MVIGAPRNANAAPSAHTIGTASVITATAAATAAAIFTNPGCSRTNSRTFGVISRRYSPKRLMSGASPSPIATATFVTAFFMVFQSMDREFSLEAISRSMLSIAFESAAFFMVSSNSSMLPAILIANLAASAPNILVAAAMRSASGMAASLEKTAFIVSAGAANIFLASADDCIILLMTMFMPDAASSGEVSSWSAIAANPAAISGLR
ncbi:hypothetical protein D3C85_685880 [compost metagenome]